MSCAEQMALNDEAGSRKPRVSVLLPVYNAAAYLAQAVESILAQTCPNFELIAVDDCSTDGSAEILAGVKDARLHVLRNERNLGMEGSLNRALALAKGEYIARMDADDISLPERFERQVQFLDGHPEIAVVGSAIERCDAGGAPLHVSELPTSPALAGWMLCFDSPLCHPSVMMRRDRLTAAGGYDERMRGGAGDYELWCRLVAAGEQICSLPEVLLRYRMGPESLTATQGTAQFTSALEAATHYLSWIAGRAFSQDEARGTRFLLSGWGNVPENVRGALRLLESIRRAYAQRCNLDEARQIQRTVVAALATRAKTLAKHRPSDALAIAFYLIREQSHAPGFHLLIPSLLRTLARCVLWKAVKCKVWGPSCLLTRPN